MAHDVFISYSHRDKAVADAICAALESSQARCWIAPRDILPGKEWAESIIDGIAGSRLMVLVFSSHANQSPQIMREVERAVSKGIIIIPFRIEDVPFSKSLEFFMGTCHWLDALTPPLKVHIDHLTTSVKLFLSRPPLQSGSETGLHAGGEGELPGSEFTNAEKLILQHLRGKPDIQWTPQIIEQGIKRNRPAAVHLFPEISNAIQSLVHRGYLLIDSKGRVAVSQMGIDYYRRLYPPLTFPSASRLFGSDED